MVSLWLDHLVERTCATSRLLWLLETCWNLAVFVKLPLLFKELLSDLFNLDFVYPHWNWLFCYRMICHVRFVWVRERWEFCLLMLATIWSLKSFVLSSQMTIRLNSLLWSLIWRLWFPRLCWRRKALYLLSQETWIWTILSCLRIRSYLFWYRKGFRSEL